MLYNDDRKTAVNSKNIDESDEVVAEMKVCLGLVGEALVAVADALVEFVWAKIPPSVAAVAEIEALPLAPVRAATTPKYAGLRFRFSSNRQAEPVPGKVEGTHEY